MLSNGGSKHHFWLWANLWAPNHTILSAAKGHTSQLQKTDFQRVLAPLRSEKWLPTLLRDTKVFKALTNLTTAGRSTQRSNCCSMLNALTSIRRQSCHNLSADHVLKVSFSWHFLAESIYSGLTLCWNQHPSENPGHEAHCKFAGTPWHISPPLDLLRSVGHRTSDLKCAEPPKLYLHL